MLYQVPCVEYEIRDNTPLSEIYYYSEMNHDFCDITLGNDFIQTVYGEVKPLIDFIEEVIEREKRNDLWEPTDLRTVSEYYKYHSKYILGPKDDPSVYVHPVFFCKSDNSDIVNAIVIILKKYDKKR